MNLPDNLYFRDEKEGHLWIYIQELINFEIRDNKGKLTFDGYCHYTFPGDEETYSPLPEKVILYVGYLNEKKANKYIIKLLTRTIHEDTSEYWSDEDEEEGGRICLTPTQHQTITFEILEECV
jgi:hypothetical protein